MGLTIESKLSELLGNERSKEVVEKHLPGISTHPMLGMIQTMTLDQIMPLSQGQITPQAIQAISEDLTKL
ncbi:MAG: hypothetical protein ACLQVJ_25500 [Syntrophobacteraceae bacterium]